MAAGVGGCVGGFVLGVCFVGDECSGVCGLMVANIVGLFLIVNCFVKKMIGGARWVFGCDFGVFVCDVLC